MKQRAPGDSVDDYAWPVDQHGHVPGGYRTTQSLNNATEDPRWLPRETAVFRRAARRWVPVQSGLVWPEEFKAIYREADTFLCGRLDTAGFAGRRSYLRCVDELGQELSSISVFGTDDDSLRMLEGLFDIARKHTHVGALLLAALAGDGTPPVPVLLETLSVFVGHADRKQWLGHALDVHGSRARTARWRGHPGANPPVPWDPDVAPPGSLCFVLCGVMFLVATPVPDCRATVDTGPGAGVAHAVTAAAVHLALAASDRRLEVDGAGAFILDGATETRGQETDHQGGRLEVKRPDGSLWVVGQRTEDPNAGCDRAPPKDHCGEGKTRSDRCVAAAVRSLRDGAASAERARVMLDAIGNEWRYDAELVAMLAKYLVRPARKGAPLLALAATKDRIARVVAELESVAADIEAAARQHEKDARIVDEVDALLDASDDE